MARHCTRCGRVVDHTGHDLIGYRPVFDRRFGVVSRRHWACRVRLTAFDPIKGTHVPDTPQRTELNQASYKHESRFT